MRTCRVCKARYTATRAMQPTCGAFECQLEYGKQAAAKAKAKRETKLRRETKEKLKALDGLPVLKKRAQAAFNAFCRERDKGLPCICCGKWPHPGGTDCGHYRSVGSAPHMRFVEDNAHSQAKQCNQWGAGRAVDYRIGLIRKIGLERVEALENDNTPRHYTREQLIEIADTYRKKLRDLRNKP